MRISILIVDDHPAVGIGTKNMIARHLSAEIHVVQTEKKAIEYIQQQRYDIVLCDWQLPFRNGIELSKQLLHMQPGLKIMIYSGYEMENQFNIMMETGISWFISKSSTSYELVKAIEMLMQDVAIVPISMLQQLRTVESNSSNDQLRLVQPELNLKERELLQAIVYGYSNRELAEKFHVTQRGVEYQIKKLFDKLEVRSRAKAITLAATMGYISSQ